MYKMAPISLSAPFLSSSVRLVMGVLVPITMAVPSPLVP
jgi:hypothetical protein